MYTIFGVTKRKGGKKDIRIIYTFTLLPPLIGVVF
jgi:hypothetical protein